VWHGVTLLFLVAKKSVSTRTRSKLSAAAMDMLRYFHQQVLLTTSLEGEYIKHLFPVDIKQFFDTVGRLSSLQISAAHSPKVHFREMSWGRGTPFPPYSPPLSIHFLIFCSFLLFSFSFSHSLYLFFYFCPPLPFLPESSHSVSRLEVIGSDRTWV